MSGVESVAASRAAGLTGTELAALEDSGQFNLRPDFVALGKAIGLDGQKLARLADGWLPTPKTIGTWRQFRMFTSADDGMTVNCFLVWDETTREAALFDTGFAAKPILETIAREQLTLSFILITHSHPDHIAALAEIRAAQPQASVRSNSASAPANQRFQLREIIPLGSLRITFRETPGHAADGVTYLISGWPQGAPDVAIVGDTIFSGSMGRGNDGWELARSKVREHILSLPQETLLCPGHGPLTTVNEERAHNPFF